MAVPEYAFCVVWFPRQAGGTEHNRSYRMPTTPMPSSFRPGDHIVYPAHGVGRVMGVEKQSVAGLDLDVFVISFEQDKMTLRVPTAKAKASGMRPLASSDVVNQAIKTLQGRARIKRTMWSRRAQEYEAKINSGDLVQIAEVVRDLHRATDQPEQSYSERQLYESALDRMARELAAVERTDRDAAVQKLAASLALKKPRGPAPTAEPVAAPEANADAEAA
jgi:CarD family transcriptional regulator